MAPETENHTLCGSLDGRYGSKSKGWGLPVDQSPGGLVSGARHKSDNPNTHRPSLPFLEHDKALDEQTTKWPTSMFMLHGASCSMRQDSYRFRPLGPGHGEGTGAVTGVAQLTRTR